MYTEELINNIAICTYVVSSCLSLYVSCIRLSIQYCNAIIKMLFSRQFNTNGRKGFHAGEFVSLETYGKHEETLPSVGG